MKTESYSAAGGVVIHDGAMLLLSRPARDEVRLPKGHVDAGESAAETALRETTEESGYADLEIMQDLGSQVVEFDYEGRHIVRTEHYFLMRLRSERRIRRGAKDAAQFRVLWTSAHNAVSRLTYEAEQHVAERALAASASSKSENKTAS